MAIQMIRKVLGLQRNDREHDEFRQQLSELERRQFDNEVQAAELEARLAMYASERPDDGVE